MSLKGHAPLSITVDHGPEFISWALEDWAWRHHVKLDFTHPGKLTENGYVESFNGRLRNECLNVTQFMSLEDARAKIDVAWCSDPTQRRNDVATLERETRLNQRAESSELIDDGEHPNGSPIKELIVEEIHAPALGRAGGTRNNATMQAHVLAPLHTHAQLQALQLVQTMNPLVVHRPASRRSNTVIRR